jgi:hypothetical protein
MAPARNDPMRAPFRVPRALARLARLVSLAGLLAGSGIAAAEPGEVFAPEIRRVLCNDVVCGSMEISWYRRFQDEDPTPTFERFGVNIRGRFRTFRDQPREFHYLQALTRFKADDFRWSRDPEAVLPPRFVDTPPFGLQRAEADPVGGFRDVLQKFDALPWYDEGDFPLFEDRPRAFLASARRHGSVTMEFETWVVCVIEAAQGPDADRVADDRYEVAALLGWTWGYEIIHRDVGAIGVDEFEDYTLSLLPLRFVTQPSAAFEAALGTTMGETVTDRFDIRLGNAAKCGGGAR